MHEIGSIFPNVAFLIFIMLMLLVQAAVAFAIVYFAARLAIRHERRQS